MQTTTPARFAEGDTVTLKDSGVKATIIMQLEAPPFSRPRYLVDYPHGNGTMRRTVTEDALQ